ncbi:MAG: GH25 family lysozyme [Clostridium sp.]
MIKMKGIDISNNNPKLNYEYMKASGVEIAIIKLKEGVTFFDPDRDIHYKGCKNAGMKVGFYHYFSKSTAALDQANGFLEELKKYSYEIIPVLDFEDPQIQNKSDKVVTFMERCKEVLGYYPVLYTYESFLSNFDDRCKKYPLWIAKYGPDDGITKVSYSAPGYNVVGFQYTSKAIIKGSNGYIDMNDFYEGILLNKVDTSINNINSSINKNVDWLSEYLKSWNWKEWVGKLQRTIGVNIDKIVGPITLKACTLLKKGMYGELVKRLQEVLKAYGFNCGDIDGIFGDNTYNAVVAFQKSRGLVADGIVGQNTWRKILGL